MATIEDNIATIKAIKSDIRTAIINKGVEVADDDGFATYPNKISQIQGGGSDVVLINGYIDANGTYTAGYDGNQWDGWSSITVDVETSSTGGAGLDFSTIGYSTELSNAIIAKYNADIAYSKTLYDSWNPNNTSASMLYNNVTQLVYAPAIDTSNVTDMSNMFFGCTSLTTIPHFDTSNVTNMNGIFYICSNLTTIPFMDTHNVTSMDYMFYGCSKLTTIPSLDTSNVNRMYSMFNGCSSLTTIPSLDTSNVTNMSNMFYGCSNLTTIPFMDTHNVTTMYSMFSSCSNLTTIPLLDCGKVTDMGYMFGFSNITTLTELGGFKDLKIDWTSGGMEICPNLTYESLMNVINNLYDFRFYGDLETTRTIKFNSKSIALLSEDDIAIATNKGWNITA